MRTVALLYHDVVPDRRFELSGFQSPDANIYKFDCAEFREHLRIIAARASAAPVVVESPDRLPSGRATVLTFDDGGASALEFIAPILAEYDWPAHFFVATDFIGHPGFLDGAQLREMRRLGHSIGSHSCTHPLLMAHCSPAVLDREWRDSVRRLEDILGEAVVTGSVPGGHYRRNVAVSAAAAGIRVLFNSEPVSSTYQVDGCLIVGRYSVQQGVPSKWLDEVIAGRLTPRLQRYVLWNAKKVLKSAGGDAWLEFRRRMLARR